MRNLKKRLARLESLVWDQSGYKCYSEAWFGYWGLQWERTMNGERNVPRVPLEFLDAVIAESDREDKLRESRSCEEDLESDF
jgi:hypothetical protein